jgi:outer membrane receptor protein involved in Fe transport
VCRSTLEGLPPLPGGGFPDPALNNCAPLNLFGEGQPSDEAIAYVFRKTTGTAVLEQSDFSANFGGPLFSIWAGDIAFATGFEYRKESGSFDVDGFSQSGLGRGAAITPISGDFSSTEFFGEVTIPLISPENNFIFDSASIDAAYRLIDNSRAGQDEVYTVGGRLRPIEDVEIRGNITRSVRAPAIVELFLPISTVFEQGNDPCDASNYDQNPIRQANCEAEFALLGVDPATFQSNVVNATAQGRTGGNPGLSNEVADAWTAGVVVRPRFAPGLTFALDWVDIELENAIEAASLTNVMEGCYDSADFPNDFCADITRDANGQVVDFLTQNANLGFQNFAGATFDMTYSTDVSALPFLGGAGDLGTLDLQVNWFYLDELELSLSGTDLDLEKGEIDDPEWRGQVNVVWTNDPLEVFVQGRYIGEGAFDIEGSPDSQDIFGIDDYWLFNGAVGYEFNDRLGIQLAVNNIFDTDPPDYANASAAVYQYDLFGRYYTLRLRARL